MAKRLEKAAQIINALWVAEQDMAGSVDPDVAQVCRQEGRALLTLDLDFSDIRAYPPALSFFVQWYKALVRLFS